MAKGQIIEFEYVTCDGCVFVKPLDRGLGFCKNKHVNMIVVIKEPNPCVWKKETDNGKQPERKG